ncbi:MAG: TetR/AcrR family transcriptional regulator [Pseudomonas sp.]|nr:TetR/AcrR family transcriptional regulator [Pseudomonas sp.]
MLTNASAFPIASLPSRHYRKEQKMPKAPHTSRPRIRTNPGPGRPPVLSEKERRKRILDAAEKVFTSKGYGTATMEEVANVAEMSKKTIYGLFTDKEHLFAVLMSDVDGFPGSAGKQATSLSNPIDDLKNHLLVMAEFVLSSRQVEITRLLISEARHSPKLVDEFYARVMRKGHAYLTEGITRSLKAAGVAKIHDPEATAMALFGAALGGLHLAALFGKQGAVPREQLLANIDLAIELMLPNLPKDDFAAVDK